MKVLFNEAARDDIASIHDYIHQHNPTAAARVTLSIQTSTNRLGSFPYSGRTGGVEGTREVVVPQLPYIVVYVITPDHVEVIAVFHAAENRPRG